LGESVRNSADGAVSKRTFTSSDNAPLTKPCRDVCPINLLCCADGDQTGGDVGVTVAHDSIVLSYLMRVIRLTLLPPATVETIPDRRHGVQVTLAMADVPRGGLDDRLERTALSRRSMALTA
jgi:hypothetical protein